MPFVDGFGRQVRKIRLSVTDRCNFRCSYCLPEEPVWLPRKELLSFEELERVARVLVPEGVTRIRLTGGEPLLRRDLHVLVGRLAGIPGLEGLSITTNGFHLAEQARALREAGLRAVTVSLDGLDAATVETLARRPCFERIQAGIRAALEVGFSPVKLNCVVMRGINENQVEAFAELARSGPYQVRFIEYMPLDSGNAWDLSKVVTGAEIRARIAARHPLEEVRDAGGDPARRWRFADGAGELGFISSVTEPFCERCDRIRLTAEGRILNCLFGHVEYDLRAVLRGGGSDAQVVELVRRAVAEKEAGHLINRPGFIKPKRAMVSIGG